MRDDFTGYYQLGLPNLFSYPQTTGFEMFPEENPLTSKRTCGWSPSRRVAMFKYELIAEIDKRSEEESSETD